MNINYSFIIPHKNSLDLLKRCVNSIPERGDVEIIIIDDNSNEDQKPHFSRPDVHIEYLTQNESKGAGRARNIGINLAIGKWLLFTDADDYYSDGFLDILDNHKDSGTDVVYFEIRVFKGCIEVAHNYKFIKEYKGDPLTTDSLKYKFQVPWNKMIRKDFIDSNKILFEECMVGNDIFFSYQVGYLSKKIGVENRPVYNYTINVNSIDHKKKNSPTYYACLFYHIYQCNEFYRFIGHPEWKKSVVKKLISILYKKGFDQFFLALQTYRDSYSEIQKTRFKFVERFK